MAGVDKIHYVRIPGALGGRAEMCRMVYALAGRPYEDALHGADTRADAVTKNPLRQFPFVERPSGEIIPQSLAMMQHAAQGTPAWPNDPNRLTRALVVALSAYDLYQAFAGFRADDLEARQRFEERKAPQFFSGLTELYGGHSFAAGDEPSFADCIVYETLGWCARRNERCRELLAGSATLSSFQARFAALPAIASFLARQAAARQEDDSV